MKSFRTELLLSPASAGITLSDPVVTIGSCFSDSIGALFVRNKFDALVNPLGTSYSAVAVHRLLEYGISGTSPNPALWVEHQELYQHFDFHSVYSNSRKEEAEHAIRNGINALHQALRKPGVVILTYGTAFAYEHLSAGTLVANCHKLPPGEFRKILLTAEQIVTSFDRAYRALKTLNPDKRLILTLSPVRHLRDTQELNSVSKATVRRAIHEITSSYPGVDYFPAYEIMMDDLRDYRFYNADMIHPSEEAIAYIWEKFSERYFSTGVRTLLAKWNSVAAALGHRAFHPASAAHQAFLRETLARLEELNGSIAVDEEITKLRAQLM